MTLRAEQLVYFIEAEGSGFVKIGTAINPLSRLRSLQVASPHRLVLRRIEEGGMAREAELHQRWAEHHERGEWFRLEGWVLDYLANKGALDQEITPEPLGVCAHPTCRQPLLIDEYCGRHQPMSPNAVNPALTARTLDNETTDR